MQLINQIPNSLPKTGLNIFDNRRIKTWNEELTEHLTKTFEIADDILNYDKLMIFIEKTSEQFIKEVY